MKELLETNDVDKSSRTNFIVDLLAYKSLLFDGIDQFRVSTSLRRLLYWRDASHNTLDYLLYWRAASHNTLDYCIGGMHLLM